MTPWWFWLACGLVIAAFLVGCVMAECGRDWLGFGQPIPMGRVRGIDVLFTADCAPIGYLMHVAGMAGLWLVIRLGTGAWRRIAG